MFQKHTGAIYLGLFLFIIAITSTYNNCSPMESLSNSSNSISSTSGGSGPTAGQLYFSNMVVPLFRSTCAGCHQGLVIAPTNGPLTIFVYANMKALVTNGGQTTNTLINKMSGIVAHIGGNQCPGGASASPCLEVATWWTKETATSAAPPANLSIYGGISYSTTNGIFGGLAANPANTNEFVTLSFYINGPMGTGVLLNSTPVISNLPVFDPKYPNRGFSFQLPATYLDGKTHAIYAYGGTTSVTPILLNATSYNMAAYPVNPLGQNYFTNNISPTCNKCHSMPYQQAYDMLANPLRANGGLATKNDLYNYALNIGNVHQGGNICGTSTSTLCTAIQTWWAMEFGPYAP